jgi:hypothetical protein
MIRNTSEYMVADGSPSYGIRTTCLVSSPAAAVPSLIRVGQAADAAAMLYAADVKLALQYSVVLDKFNHSDAEIISDLRAAHPEELKEAEAIVAKRLVSPAVWMRCPKSAYTKAVVEDAETNGTLVRQMGAALTPLGLSVAMLVIVIGLAENNAPPLASVVIVLAMFIGAQPKQKKLSRTINPGGIPTRIEKGDARILWGDVVNATLVFALQNKGIPVDRASITASLRGWNHTR